MKEAEVNWNFFKIRSKEWFKFRPKKKIIKSDLKKFLKLGLRNDSISGVKKKDSEQS